MPKGLNALVIAPKAEEKEEPAEDESGLRDAFDELEAAMQGGDSNAAFEALSNFCQMCAMKAGDY